MTWGNDSSDNDGSISDRVVGSQTDQRTTSSTLISFTCPACGHNMPPLPGRWDRGGGGIDELPGLPAGVKFDPTDQEILEHLEAKAGTCCRDDVVHLHPLIDDFIPTLDGHNGICYTHPEKLPGVSKDGQIRHFFHRPSKAYTTGTRKRRKVHTDNDGNETRWHKTGKTRPVVISGAVRGFKKILVLYTNYGRQRKPEKTNWVMHQYHLGHDEEEKDGELVVSKVFYQTQPRQCKDPATMTTSNAEEANSLVDYYGHGSANYNVPSFGHGRSSEGSPPELIPNLGLHRDDSSSFMRSLTCDASKGRLLERK